MYSRSKADIKALLPDQTRGFKDLLEGDLNEPGLVGLVQQRDPEVGRVGQQVRRHGDPEGLVERRVEDIGPWAVGLGRGAVLLGAPCHLDAGVQLIAVALEAEGAGDEHRGEADDLVLGLALGGRDDTLVGDEVVEPGVEDDLGVHGLALVVAVGNILDDLGQQPAGTALLGTTDANRLLDGQA
ncbi:hypothetical protein VMCG_03450 [Cytospora schulzeri]|uniref:Uncharacterized protein n=1 Tax=Cytospora schulzeri TaxID=448051 RepID=A0A423WW77_9PEZI|nr:hypothetical protein VMCG_03450 [Valsa malicola]